MPPDALDCEQYGTTDRRIPFVQSWINVAGAPQQKFAWMHQMLDLWVGLGVLACQKSVLSLENLVVDARAHVCIERLIRDLPTSHPRAADSPKARTAGPPDLRALADLWQALPHSSVPSTANADRAISTALAEIERTPNLTVARLRRILDKHDRAHRPARRIEADAKPRLEVERAARTDVGRQRARNEDTFAMWERRDRHASPDGEDESLRGLYVLCDGMGGHASGDAASQLAAQTAIDFFQSHWQGEMPGRETILDGIFAANRAVYSANQSDRAEGFGRMGTTLVALLLHDTQATIVNVGDSRLYRYTRSRGLEQLTTDSDFANALIRNGTPASRAYRHPNAHQLTQAIGPYDEDALDPDLYALTIEEDSLFLLASDGLTDRELLGRPDVPSFEAMLDPQSSLDRAASELVHFANRENGHDNITVILVRVRILL